ncbi:MAG TPA: septum site-determining protein MinC [Polyangia bacterium]|nr:septum site-determining protein MinC [Polyangia bacterium]
MLDTMFATETMAELSARQGRVADAVAIYRHLLNGAEADERSEKWKGRLAELEARPTGAAALPAPGATPRDRITPAQAGVAEATGQRASLVIREPVRSGQVIYAEGCDLIVMAPVHSGAQLLADGHIHVYGPLKGRAVAGAHGLRDAQLFCLSLEAELVGVDTGYLLSDDIPAALSGGPARVFLTAEGTCTVAALPVGRAGAPAAANQARRIFGDRRTAR